MSSDLPLKSWKRLAIYMLSQRSGLQICKGCVLCAVGWCAWTNKNICQGVCKQEHHFQCGCPWIHCIWDDFQDWQEVWRCHSCHHSTRWATSSSHLFFSVYTFSVHALRCSLLPGVMLQWCLNYQAAYRQICMHLYADLPVCTPKGLKCTERVFCTFLNKIVLPGLADVWRSPCEQITSVTVYNMQECWKQCVAVQHVMDGQRRSQDWWSFLL